MPEYGHWFIGREISKAAAQLQLQGLLLPAGSAPDGLGLPLLSAAKVLGRTIARAGLPTSAVKEGIFLRQRRKK